jgi:hypothetical protein
MGPADQQIQPLAKKDVHDSASPVGRIAERRNQKRHVIRRVFGD